VACNTEIYVTIRTFGRTYHPAMERRSLAMVYRDRQSHVTLRVQLCSSVFLESFRWQHYVFSRTRNFEHIFYLETLILSHDLKNS
jgi:hypothetical protein